MSFYNKIFLGIIFFFHSLLNSLTFAWITDTHIEKDLQLYRDSEIRYSISSKLLTDTVELINKSSVDFTVITGDILNSAKSWNLDEAKLILSKLNKPFFVVIGNNDFSTPMDGVGIGKYDFHYVFRENEPNFDGFIWYTKVKNYLLIGIDNIKLNGEMNFDNIILKKSGAILKTYGFDSEGIIILMHYPILVYTFKKESQIQKKAEKFIELCRKYNVTLILSGHYHYNEVKKINKTYQFIQSSLSVYPHIFSIVKIDDEKINQEIKSPEKNYILLDSKQYFNSFLSKLKLKFGNEEIEELSKKMILKKGSYVYER